jgi:hypothetical protein
LATGIEFVDRLSKQVETVSARAIMLCASPQRSWQWLRHAGTLLYGSSPQSDCRVDSRGYGQ